MSRALPPRDRAAEASWLRMGGSICRRTREISAERRAARPTITSTEALADLSAAIDRAEAAR